MTKNDAARLSRHLLDAWMTHETKGGVVQALWMRAAICHKDWDEDPVAAAQELEQVRAEYELHKLLVS